MGGGPGQLWSGLPAALGETVDLGDVPAAGETDPGRHEQARVVGRRPPGPPRRPLGLEGADRLDDLVDAADLAHPRPDESSAAGRCRVTGPWERCGRTNDDGDPLGSARVGVCGHSTCRRRHRPTRQHEAQRAEREGKHEQQHPRHPDERGVAERDAAGGVQVGAPGRAA